MAARKTATELAAEALERIAKHEKECGERWAEASLELRRLGVQVAANSARWEKLAWLVIGTVVAGALASVVRTWF